MKEKVYNNHNIKDSDIHDKVVRVKALIVNSKDEILLCEDFDTIQFPGGHIENEEELNDALKREIKEEVGITLTGSYEPFFKIKYILKDHPVIGHNRALEIYYYYIFTDEVFNLDNINLDDQERKGDFKRYYVPLKSLKKFLYKNNNRNRFNRIVSNEMLLAFNNLKRI